MKAFAVLLLAAFGVTAAGAANPASVGYHEGGTVIESSQDHCYGDEVYNHDGSFENGYAWQYAGCVPPYYGAFGEGVICESAIVDCVIIWATTLPGYFHGQTCDVYVWEDGITAPPGAVLKVVANVLLDNVPDWPAVGENYVPVYYYGLEEGCTIGYWGNWPGEGCAYFVAADLNGFGGHPWTHIAPGIGYPTGWNDPSIVWGPTMSLGLGADFVWLNPAEARSWGSVKALFR